jgi:hypothetical protein
LSFNVHVHRYRRSIQWVNLYVCVENNCFLIKCHRSPFTLYNSYLVLEGRAGQPKMMSVGLHCRLSRPGRVAALAEFVDYAKSYGREVWITTREDIANHWYENHLPRGCGNPIIAGENNGVVDSSNTGSAGYGKHDFTSSTSTPTEASSSSSRFSFLGNLKAPRNSKEYKDSLKVTKSKSEEIVKQEDVI